MDIDLLSKMVKELILDNDKVVLPGLGSFVAEIVPSTFTDKGYTINPPYRRLYFRSRPDQGEELAKFYAESNKVNLEVADKIVKDFVQELKSVLHVKKTVIFPGLGRLRATKENTVFFVADEDLDIYPDGFGLEPISLKTHQESREEVSAAVEGLKSILEVTPGGEKPSEELVVEEATEGVVEEVVEVVPDEVVGFVEEMVADETISETVPEISSVNASVNAVEDASEDVTVKAVEDVTVNVAEDTTENAAEEATDNVVVELTEDASEEGNENPTLEIVIETTAEETAVKGETGEVVTEVVGGVVAVLQEQTDVVVPKKSFWKKFFKAVLWIVVTVVVFLAVYVAVSRLCPGLLDRFLYTAEELQIVNDL